MKKTEKSPRKKYNTGGLLSPVVPITPEVPEQEESLLQAPVEPTQQDNLLVPAEEPIAPAPVQKPEEPVIQESNESFLAAQQRSTRMQSTGHGGLGSAFRPDLEYDEDTVISPKVEYGDDGLPVNLDYHTRVMIEESRREEELDQLNYDPRLAEWEQSQAELAYDGSMTPEKYDAQTTALSGITVPMLRKRKEFLVNQNGSRFHQSVFDFVNDLKNKSPELFKEAFPELLVNGEIFYSKYSEYDFSQGKTFADLVLEQKENSEEGALTYSEAYQLAEEVTILAVADGNPEIQAEMVGVPFSELLRRYDYTGDGAITSRDAQQMAAAAAKPTIITDVEYLDKNETHYEAIKRLNLSPEEASKQVDDVLDALPLQLYLNTREFNYRYDFDLDGIVTAADSKLAAKVANNESISKYQNIYRITDKSQLEEQNNFFRQFSQDQLLAQRQHLKTAHADIASEGTPEEKTIWTDTAIAIHKSMDFSDGNFAKSPFWNNFVFSDNSPYPQMEMYEDRRDYWKAAQKFTEQIFYPVYYVENTGKVADRVYREEMDTEEERTAFRRLKYDHDLSSEYFYPYSGAYPTPNYSYRDTQVLGQSNYKVRDYEDVDLEIREPSLNPYINLSDSEKAAEKDKILAAYNFQDNMTRYTHEGRYRISDGITTSAVALHLSMDFSDGDYTKSPFYDYIPPGNRHYSFSFPRPERELYSTEENYKLALNKWEFTTVSDFAFTNPPGSGTPQKNVALKYNGSMLDWYGKADFEQSLFDAKVEKINETFLADFEVNESQLTRFEILLDESEVKKQEEENNPDLLEKRINERYRRGINAVFGTIYKGDFQPVHPTKGEALKRFEYLLDGATTLEEASNDSLRQINEYAKYLEENDPELFNNLEFYPETKDGKIAYRQNNGELIPYTSSYIKELAKEYIFNLKVRGFKDVTVEKVDFLLDEIAAVNYHPGTTQFVKDSETTFIKELATYDEEFVKTNYPKEFYRYTVQERGDGITYFEHLANNPTAVPEKDVYERYKTTLPAEAFPYGTGARQKHEVYFFSPELWKEWYPELVEEIQTFRPLADYLEDNPSETSISTYYIVGRGKYLLSEGVSTDDEVFKEFLKTAYDINKPGFIKAITNAGINSASYQDIHTKSDYSVGDTIASKRYDFISDFPELSYPETPESFLLEYAKNQPRAAVSGKFEGKDLPIEQLILPASRSQVVERFLYLKDSGEPEEPLIQTIKENYPGAYSDLQKEALIPVDPIYEDAGETYSPFDIDRDGVVDALTDGLLFLRALFGLTGEKLTKEATGLSATKNTQEINDRLNYILKLSRKNDPELFNIFDIDNNGTLDPLTDGLLLLRYAFNAKREGLVDSSIAQDSPFINKDVETQFTEIGERLAPYIDNYKKERTDEDASVVGPESDERYDSERDERVSPDFNINIPIKYTATLGDARKILEGLSLLDNEYEITDFKNRLLLNGQHLIYTTLFPDDEPPTPKHLDNSVREGYDGSSTLDSFSLGEVKLRLDYLEEKDFEAFNRFNNKLGIENPELFTAIYSEGEYIPEIKGVEYPLFENNSESLLDYASKHNLSQAEYSELHFNAITDWQNNSWRTHRLSKEEFLARYDTDNNGTVTSSDISETFADDKVFFMPEFTADSPEPNLSDFPEDKRDAVFEAWQVATFEMPTFDAFSDEPILTNYPEAVRQAVYDAYTIAKASFVVPTFNQLSPEPVVSDYPEGRFNEVYEAWLKATADPVFDANSPEPSIADYPAERFDKIYNDWLEATFVMPTFDASSSEPDLNIYPESQRDAVFQAWLDSRPEEEPETEEPTEAPKPIVPESPIPLASYVTVQYSKNSLPPVESDFAHPNFPTGAYEEELKAWAAAKDIQKGDPFPVRGDLAGSPFLALITEWINQGNTLNIGIDGLPEEPKASDTIITATSEPDYSYFENKLMDPEQYPYTSRVHIETRNERYQEHIDDLKIYYAERDAIFAGTATEPPTNPGLMQHPGPYPIFSSPEEALSLAEQQEDWVIAKDAYDAYVMKKALYDLSSAEYQRQVIENMEGGGEQPDPETEEPTDEDNVEIPEVDDILIIVPESTPEEDYSFLIKPTEPVMTGAPTPGNQFLHAQAVERYNIQLQEYRDNIAKMKDIYDHYYPIINGQNMSAPPRVPEKVYPPAALPDNPSYDQIENYKKEQRQYVIYQKAQKLYLQAQPIYDSFIGGNMSTEDETKVRTSSVVVSGTSSTGAPTGLTQTVPVSPDVTVDDPVDMPTEGDTITADDAIEKLEDAGTVADVSVAAPTMPATQGQALPDEVVGPDEDVTSTGYTASTSDADVTATAANVTGLTQTAGATTGAAPEATAATASAEDIAAAKGTAATGELSENSLAVAATAMNAAKADPQYIELDEKVNQFTTVRNTTNEYKELVNKKNSATTPENKAYFQAQIDALPVSQVVIQAEAERLEFLESRGAQKIAEVEGPGTADTYNATTLSSEDLTELVNIAEERGVDVDELPEYDMAKQRIAQEAVAAAGEAAKIEEAAQAAEASKAAVVEANDIADALSVEIEETPAYTKAASRTAQEAEAAEGTAAEVSSADTAVDLETREAITGTAPQGTAAEIGGVPTYEAAQMQAVTSEDRTLNASEMIEVVAELPEEMSAAIAQDPAEVMAQLDEDPVTEVVVKVAALPQEALVSVQMETLLAGMDDGEIPTWARPTVAALDGIMARRGLSASTVGRDAMFNAIIQSALPIAQSNATALKDMALANLSNEQQAAITNANNSMQLRIQNLANRQLAVSETARMAQEIAVKQSTFDQQAAVISSEQQQQTALINTQNAQAKASADAQMAQQAAIAEFSENSRRDYENLKALNDANVNNLNAEQAARLKNYDAQITTMVRQAELNQDIEKANLSASLSVELQNLSQQNDAAKDTMTAENQERLVNLQTLVDLRKTNATFAQQMDMANLTNEQQIELAMLQEKAAADTANFTADNQFRLNELNNKVARSIRQAELDARIAEINFDASLKLELTELTEKNATNRANMTAENQVRLANLNALIDFKKTNASFAQQMEIANLSNEQQITVANLTEKAAADAANFTEANRFELQRLTIASQLLSSNEQLRLNADLARLNTEERVALANLTYTNQFDSAKMTAENTAELQRYEKQMEAGRVNAQLAQQMGLQELSNAQQAAMFNAQINSNLDFKQFDADQQVQIANSTFMQSMTIREFDAQQQVAIQNATMLANRNLAEADQATKIAITNAQNFLQMDMANLSNDQQVAVLNAQMAQQAMLSDLAAENAAAQFSAANQQQADQYMASLGVQIEQYNVSAAAARSQFNASEANRQAAIKAGNTLQAASISAQMQADIAKFNEQQDLAREQWNAANAQAVEQSNVQWRRQANTANTAAQNAANQQNAQIAFNLTAQEQTQLWQLLRDEAAYARQAYENDEQRKAQLYATAISNEKVASSATKLQDILDTDF